MESDKLSLALATYYNLPPAFQRLQERLGVDQDGRWELLIKYHGNLEEKEQEYKFVGEYLTCGYAIVFLFPQDLDKFSTIPEVDYIQLPSRLWYSLEESKSEICVGTIQQNDPASLYGTGVLIAFLDSGIDYAHPDFRNPDGTTRIVALWDQTIPTEPTSERVEEHDGDGPPEGFLFGVVYDRDRINLALQQRTRQEQLKIVPSVDVSGHGTHVAGIACGNGRASDGRYMGVAPEASLLVVKLGEGGRIGFPKTTRLMEGIEFALQTAQLLQMPLVINISLGNNEGPHSGTDMTSAYIDQIATNWKTSICVGTGNEANLGRHREGVLKEQEEIVELVVREEYGNLTLQLWKNYVDSVSILIVAPDGTTNRLEQRDSGIHVYEYKDCYLVINYGDTTPYQGVQEIYMQWLSKGERLEDGIWTFYLQPERIRDGRFDFWLGTGASVGSQTRFLRSSVNTTLTMPSSTFRVISVGAYNGRTEEVAPFSGRGYTRNSQLKPDLVAPGVDIMSTAPNNSYTIKSGTSMATPFVSGAAALLMEWGIIRENDSDLYGEKLKSFLQKGAKPIGRENAPNPQTGYGALCIEQSLPL